MLTIVCIVKIWDALHCENTVFIAIHKHVKNILYSITQEWKQLLYNTGKIWSENFPLLLPIPQTVVEFSNVMNW